MPCGAATSGARGWPEPRREDSGAGPGPHIREEEEALSAAVSLWQVLEGPLEFRRNRTIVGKVSGGCGTPIAMRVKAREAEGVSTGASKRLSRSSHCDLPSTAPGLIPSSWTCANNTSPVSYLISTESPFLPVIDFFLKSFSSFPLDSFWHYPELSCYFVQLHGLPCDHSIPLPASTLLNVSLFCF